MAVCGCLVGDLDTVVRDRANIQVTLGGLLKKNHEPTGVGAVTFDGDVGKRQSASDDSGESKA